MISNYPCGVLDRDFNEKNTKSECDECNSVGFFVENDFEIKCQNCKGRGEIEVESEYTS